MAAIGVVIVGVATSLGVALRYSRTGGLVGLTITYALDVSQRFAFLGDPGGGGCPSVQVIKHILVHELRKV